MCSIIGSADFNRLNKLKEINSHRGSLSHSIAIFDSDGSLLSLVQEAGPMADLSSAIDGVYAICHQQAPTTQELNTIHPANCSGNLLWHNGIVKAHYLRKMIDQTGDLSEWDTHQINTVLSTNGFDALNPIEGSFTCIWYNSEQKKLYMFRNAISPLFTNSTDISSVAFDDSAEILSGVVYEFNFKEVIWQQTNIKFNNVETPFFYFD